MGNQNSKGNKNYILIIDFEADVSKDGEHDHEIIEFPALLVNAVTKELIGEFHNYVKLATRPKLSDFTKTLTNITDEQVANGVEWSECLNLFDQWCQTNNITSENTTIVTCGDWDLKTMLPKQLKITNTKLPPNLANLFKHWTNLKSVFSREYATVFLDMKGMLHHLKLELEGQHHSGIQDCRNLLRIIQAMTNNVDFTIYTH